MSEWTPVSERLPEEEDLIDITGYSPGFAGKQWVCDALFEGGIFLTMQLVDSGYYNWKEEPEPITHWRERPAPPLPQETEVRSE